MADRTVSARLRADVTGYIAAMRAAQRATRQLQDQMQQAGRGGTFEQPENGAERLERALQRLSETQERLVRQQREASNETRRAGDEAERASRRTDEQTESTRRNAAETGNATRQQERHTDAVRRSTSTMEKRGSAMASLASGAAAVAAAELSAAAAVGAFGAMAAPSILEVVAAQEDLAANWDSLSPLQRGAAVQVQNLKDNYRALADSFEPEAMGAFNTVLRTGADLLPMFSDLAEETSVDVQRFLDRIGAFATGPEMRAFLDSMGQQAPVALDQLGTAATTTGSLALQLATDLTPVGVSVLSLANGALGMVNSLAHVNPLFAQFAITALLLRAPVLGLVGGVGMLSTRMRTFAAETRGATVATRALSVVSALGPALWVAGAAALFLWASNAGQARGESQKFTDELQRQYRAVGNNLVGYQQLASDLLPRLQDAERRAREEMESKNEVTAQSAKDVLAYSGKLAEAEKAVKNITTSSRELAHTYGITTDEAIQLANATGVDLSTAVDKNGNLTLEASQKINQYKLAVEEANTPTKAITLSLERASNEALSLEDRVNALTAAWDASFTPSLRAYQATTQLRQGYRDLAEQLAAAKGRMDGNSESSLKLRQAFSNQLSSVRELSDAIFNKTRNVEEARAAVEQQLPLLYALAGRNREAKAQVDALAASLGINTGAIYANKASFIAQATAMLGSKTRAEQLWASYVKLRGETNAGSGSLSRYITQVTNSANAARIQTLRTDGARGAQTTYNQRIREALPVLYSLAGNNKAARAQVDALARSTGNATHATNVSREAFLRTARSMGLSETRAEGLWKELKKIPRNVRTNVDINAEGKWSNWRSMPGATTGGPAHLVPRAKGGPIPSLGPESSRAYDSVPALLRVDEHVWTPEEVDAVGGHDAMYRLRAMARAGQLQGYKRGGRVALDRGGSTRAVVDDVMAPINRGYAGFITGIIRSMAASWKKYMASGGHAMAWARAQVGKPYLWGGVGPAGYDCSGFTSAITNVIQRRSPHQRRHTTHSFGASSGPDGFVRNLQSPFMVGVTDAGVGHMAGTLNGVAVESSGSVGVRVGGGARGANNSMFTRRYGLRMAQGGAVTEAEARLAREALQPGASRREVDLAATLGLTGDPSSSVSPVRPRIPAYGSGGWVRGRPGRDTNLIAATRDEFVVSKGQAAKYPGLIEAINAGQVGQAMVSPLRSAAPMAVGAGALAGGGGRSPSKVVIELHNHGVIASKLQAQDWLAGGLDELQRQGRLPWPAKK